MNVFNVPPKPSRAEQREELIFVLGKFLSPIERLIESDGDVSKEIPFVRAQHVKELGPFTNNAYEYCNVAGIEFGQEYSNIIGHLREFEILYRLLIEKSKAECRAYFNERLADIKKAIRAVPCEFDPMMLSAGSPFEAYLRLRTIFASASKQLEVFDPWLGTEVFYRYLSQVPAGVSIIVVTTTKRLSGSAKNDLVAVSELFAMERGSHYRLIESPSVHDRHIRCDSQVFHLGGSLKDAAKKDPYTVTLVDSTGAIGAELVQTISTGTEWFGPSTPVHKK